MMRALGDVGVSALTLTLVVSVLLLVLSNLDLLH